MFRLYLSATAGGEGGGVATQQQVTDDVLQVDRAVCSQEYIHGMWWRSAMLSAAMLLAFVIKKEEPCLKTLGIINKL